VSFDATPTTVFIWTDTIIFVGAPGGNYSTVTVIPTVGDSCSLGGTYSYDNIEPEAPTITTPADGSTLYSSTVVTVIACSEGICKEQLDGVDWQSCNIGFTGVPDGPHTIKATCTDDCGNVSAAATSSFDVDTSPIITIVSPTEGSTVIVINGLTYGPDNDTISGDGVPDGIADYLEGLLPVDIDFTDCSGTGLDTSGFTVLVNGATSELWTLINGSVQAGQASPAGFEGYLAIEIPTTSGSFGEVSNVLIEASGLKDNEGTPGDPVSVTPALVKLAVMGVGDTVVIDSATTLSLPINIYLDPSWNDGFGNPRGFGQATLDIHFDPAIITVKDFTASSGPFAATQFTSGESNTPEPPDNAPNSPIYSGFADTGVFHYNQTADLENPRGFFNFVNIEFDLETGPVSSPTTSPIYINVRDDAPANFTDTDGVPIPPIPIKYGEIIVIPTP